MSMSTLSDCDRRLLLKHSCQLSTKVESFTFDRTPIEMESFSSEESSIHSPVLFTGRPSSPTFYRPNTGTFTSISRHIGQGALIPPHTSLARAIVMGNSPSSSPPPASESSDRRASVRLEPHSDVPPPPPPPPPSELPSQASRPASGLTLLLREQQQRNAQQAHQGSLDSHEVKISPGDSKNPSSSMSEADSASGPPPSSRFAPGGLGSSAPIEYSASRKDRSRSVGKISDGLHHVEVNSRTETNVRRYVFHEHRQKSKVSIQFISDLPFHRSVSNRDFIFPLSGSPYTSMLHKKFEIEKSMEERFRKLRTSEEETFKSYSRPVAGSSTNQRNKRRAEHTQAVIDELCEVVADLFLAESKLLKSSIYGVSHGESREKVVTAVRAFVSALPSRYALGADSPSEVLLHMRLMAATRADRTKAVLHIHKVEDEDKWRHILPPIGSESASLLRLVTLSCGDANGLLEFITKILSSGGSRVLDADVMLSSDGIVLDRFVVEMKGRLRLDKTVRLIEGFLKKATEAKNSDCSSSSRDFVNSGPLYFAPPETLPSSIPRDIALEMATAVPLSEVIGSASAGSLQLPPLRKHKSLPHEDTAATSRVPQFSLPMRRGPNRHAENDSGSPVKITGGRKQLVNRPGVPNLDSFETTDVREPKVNPEYYFVPTADYGIEMGFVERNILIIPFDEMMLVETIGTGRVSTIYRAIWRQSEEKTIGSGGLNVKMLALKVAMVNPENGDTSHVEELRQEADIASRLQHRHICDLIGVAFDSDCFCLAYDYCEGGSLHQLLADTSRYYDYLPIAMDIANGMAYLHSRNIIHRDLKPSNVLLTRDHRAKISDFGLSVTNRGQELTAETGTYRYMAPECIRHEQYSSNADVYSFGICLWQLITREVPFATMTPVQAAYAVAEGRRPDIPSSTPRRLQEIIRACWDQDSYKRPSFTYIAMALADYAKMAFSPANVGAQTLQIANETLATIDGNSTVNVDFTAPVLSSEANTSSLTRTDSASSDNLGLEIE